MITLQLGNQTVAIEEGELVSYTLSGTEYIHQKGAPGWSSSDTEMFPNIGPTKGNNYEVPTPKGIAYLDQHGLLRLMDYRLVQVTKTTAVYSKQYKANTPIPNKKYPESSTLEYQSWPYDFEFQKTFKLTPSGLEVHFVVEAEPGMPYMLGYHPAFVVHTPTAQVISKQAQTSVEEVLAIGDDALYWENAEEVVLQDTAGIRLETEGFGHCMLWTPAPNMICLEPITFYPLSVPPKELYTGFRILEGARAEFKTRISILP